MNDEQVLNWIKGAEAFPDIKCLNYFKLAGSFSRIEFNKAMAHYASFHYSISVYHLLRAIELDAYFAVAYFQLGIAYFQLEDFINALISFERCLKISFY
jgi:hypothetical protein